RDDDGDEQGRHADGDQDEAERATGPRIATPMMMTRMAGSIAARKTASPMLTWPVTCSPQRWRKRAAERRRVASGPGPSRAMMGMARKVASPQATGTPRRRSAPMPLEARLEGLNDQVDRGHHARPAGDLRRARPRHCHAAPDGGVLAVEDLRGRGGE